MTMRTLVALGLAVGVSNFGLGVAGAADDKPPVAGQVKPVVPVKPPAPKPPAYTSIEEAGPDYAIQGEYGAAEAGKLPWGAQVIALGGGKFRAVLFPGGLPGAGWSGVKASKVTLDGKRDAAPAPLALAGKGGYTATTADGKSLTVKTDKGETVELPKIERVSPTMGAKPPAGAVSLFDGTSLDKWEKGKLVDGKLGVSGGEPKTKDKFTDFTLHVEFVSPFMPTAGGQGRGNSGVYLQNRYEVQVLDSFGLEGVHDECGGIYKNAEPKVNMCMPPLQWQTYDIEFTAPKWNGQEKTKNAVVTIRHNGVTIHEGLEIQGSTGGGEKELPTPGSLKFQDHGNPVFYRNVWIVEKK